MKAVLLVGCGNIGFRHLQALGAMSTPAEITVVEPNTAVHGRILDPLVVAESSGHGCRLVTEVPPGRSRFDLVVVATTAECRRSVVEQVLERHDVNVMILEKVLFQTLMDLDEVQDLLEKRGVTAFVNCGRRSFPGYQDLRAACSGSRPISLRVRGRRIGLASNAVHFLDLAEFLNRAELTTLDLARLQSGAVPGRRPGCVEIFGEITGRLSNGAVVTVESLDNEPMQVLVDLEGREGSAVHVDELARTVQFGQGSAAAFDARNVSETPEIYEDALSEGVCDLTPYMDSARQHRLYLTALRSHLGLSNERDEPCPIS